MRWPWTPYGRTELISWGATSFAITLTTLYFYPWLAIVPAAACAFVLNFFRDPDRPISSEPGVLVSPADGKVTDITRLPDGEYVGGPAIRVGIFLNVFNVHVNRVPCAGRVDYLRHREGKFLDARDPNCATENERQDLGLIAEGPDGQPMKVLVRQIAGLIARRIVCPVTVGQELGRGERYGMIKFGSRTEIYLPVESGFEALVQVGDLVKGGATILGRMTGIAVDSRVTTPVSAARLATGTPPTAEPEAGISEASAPDEPLEPKKPLPEKPAQPEKQPIPEKPAEPEKPVQPEKKPLPEQPEHPPLPQQPGHPGPPPQPAEPPAPEPPKAEARHVDASVDPTDVTPDPAAVDPDEDAVAAPEPPASDYHEPSASLPATVQEYQARSTSPEPSADEEESIEGGPPAMADPEPIRETDATDRDFTRPSTDEARPGSEADSPDDSRAAAAETFEAGSEEMAEPKAEPGRDGSAAEAASTEAKLSKKDRRARRKNQRGTKRKQGSPEMAGDDMSDEDELEDDESSHDHSPSTSGNQSS
ncbi:MAG: phosphatidylserine decarboxylase family protein [Planctomycetota bacterium]